MRPCVALSLMGSLPLSVCSTCAFLVVGCSWFVMGLVWFTLMLCACLVGTMALSVLVVFLLLVEWLVEMVVDSIILLF